jgi:hypothetical protein
MRHIGQLSHKVPDIESDGPFYAPSEFLRKRASFPHKPVQTEKGISRRIRNAQHFAQLRER